MSIRRERESELAYALWQEKLVSACQSWQRGEIDRRGFLKCVSTILAAAAIIPTALPLQSKENHTTLITEWREDPWWTMNEVQEHLFPHAEDSPGAKDIRATHYLKRELANPRVPRNEADFIVKGVEWLNDMTQKTESARFVDLNTDKREAVLRQIEKSSEGQRWISLLIYYVIEALLTDPIYGGNPDGSGWKWLAHHVGFPRPTKDKVYSKL